MKVTLPPEHYEQRLLAAGLASSDVTERRFAG
jgi:hypothetical protein